MGKIFNLTQAAIAADVVLKQAKANADAAWQLRNEAWRNATPDEAYEYYTANWNDELPYIKTTRSVVDQAYNPKYGDDRICVCEDPYYRHFDTYEDMRPVGCKYCGCNLFVEQT